VGAVTVIIIFGISLTRNMMDERTKAMNHQFLFSIVAAVVLTLIILGGIRESSFLGSEHPLSLVVSSVGAANSDVAQSTTDGSGSGRPFQGGAAYLGGVLLKPENGFAFAFEFVSVLLLSALIGAIVIARKEPS